jgi:hypothetical protein
MILNKETGEKLKERLPRITYKPNWAFQAVLTHEWILRITIVCEDSTGQHQYLRDVAFGRELSFDNTFVSAKYVDEDTPFYVIHNFPVPPYKMDDEEMQRWVFEKILDVELHEAMEFFKVDRKVVYFPDHEPGGNPYLIKRR